MKHVHVGRQRKSFQVVASAATAQAATMVLQPGESTGDPKNEHPHSEQWLLVLSGTGRAIVDNHRVSLRQNSLLLIEEGELHEIKNTGDEPLVTLNLYAPPAYAEDGELLAAKVH